MTAFARPVAPRAIGADRAEVRARISRVSV